MNTINFTLTDAEIKYTFSKGRKFVVNQWLKELSIKDRFLMKLAVIAIFLQRFALAALILIGTIFILLSYRTSVSFTPLHAAFVMVLAISLMVLIRYFAGYSQIIVDKKRLYRGLIQISFNDQFLIIKKDRTEEEIAWSYVSRIESDNNFVYLMSPSLWSCAIPKRILKEESKEGSFLNGMINSWRGSVT